MTDKSIKQSFERQDRNLILFVLGCIVTMATTGLYLTFIAELLPSNIAVTIPIIILPTGFFTSVYFYRRS